MSVMIEERFKANKNTEFYNDGCVLFAHLPEEEQLFVLNNFKTVKEAEGYAKELREIVEDDDPGDYTVRFEDGECSIIYVAPMFFI